MIGISEIAVVVCAIALGADIATKLYYWAALMSVCVIVNAYVLGWFTY